ncbi:hypothetical protein IQ241_13200 [Romeria aff. gracilis LEGE 07310]|uniref:DUF3566 domain-containing protein n=1 Tax=Vasconcelosia minhoensis LEGE 07310 TaxID=915328 RepID=A0A8J7AY14_9CYAN|nr:hypothetical protein [Romeria gracilis]MBE9078237.1 hypothetical protein [Romeria aff. gracilis LEGE 07310]
MTIRKVTIRKVDALSAAKIQGSVLGLFGLILAVLFALFLMAGITLDSDAPDSAIPGVVGGVSMIIFLPLFYAILGFIFGLVGALIYNLVAKVVGGIELEFDYNQGQLIEPLETPVEPMQ